MLTVACTAPFGGSNEKFLCVYFCVYVFIVIPIWNMGICESFERGYKSLLIAL